MSCRLVMMAGRVTLLLVEQDLVQDIEPDRLVGEGDPHPAAALAEDAREIDHPAAAVPGFLPVTLRTTHSPRSFGVSTVVPAE